MGIDLCYFDPRLTTAREVLRIEQLAVERAVRNEWILFVMYQIPLSSALYPNLLALETFPIFLSRN